MGMRIIAVDGGGEKQKLCMSLGAEHYIDFETCQNLAQEIHRLTKYGCKPETVPPRKGNRD